ncbi:hypothetical protein [Tissierella praeacuta]|uniref:hypothetical protein n=1 Tax=Tissierella praeacuta TaxID=43131 RepID=UPI00333E19E0
MNIFINEEVKKKLKEYQIKEDEFMSEVMKEVLYDEPSLKHEIILILEIDDKSYGAIGKKYRTSITITNIYMNPIIV